MLGRSAWITFGGAFKKGLDVSDPCPDELGLANAGDEFLSVDRRETRLPEESLGVVGRDPPFLRGGGGKPTGKAAVNESERSDW